MRSHRDILKDEWDTYAACSRALEAQGVHISDMGVARWGQRDSIPPEYWPALKRAAETAGSERAPTMINDLAEYCAFVLTANQDCA